MRDLRLHAGMVLATMFMFVALLAINEWLFAQLEFVPGINWVYLPAGIRLLSTLLFAESGAIGLLLISWIVSFFYFFPHDPVRAFAGGILATAAPYGVYLLARWRYGLAASLANLTPLRLLGLALVYSIASPLLHHIWFALQGQQDLVRGFVVMCVGDLVGSLIVLYAAKMLLNLWRHGVRSAP